MVEADLGTGVETCAELVGDGLAEDAWRGGDKLSELHEGAAEVLESPPERVRVSVDRKDPLSDLSQLPEHEGTEMPCADGRDRVSPSSELPSVDRGQVARKDPRRCDVISTPAFYDQVGRRGDCIHVHDQIR